MFDLSAYLAGFGLILTVAAATWCVSVAKRNVTIVDSLWPLLFVFAAGAYLTAAPHSGPRATLIILLVSLWGARLSTYLTWRNWGEAEDRRYQAIRRHNEPHFALKSLFIIFGLQGTLAWVISLPLLAAINSPGEVSALDFAGVALWAIGFGFESIGDWQLARFKKDPANRGRVMDRGLWRFTRHPNYFGDFCVWWGFYLLAAAGGGWWSFVGPALMSILLLRVSGVALLEKDIGKRRPDYREYVRRTSAFFPRPPRAISAVSTV